MIKGQNILVIGGAGFIGSHLCEHLSSLNAVVSLDNYLTSSNKNHVHNVQYVKGSSKDINSILADLNPSYIFHLGEYSRVEASFEDYDLVVENNLFPLKEVLNYTKAKKAKLIYAGSSTKFADKRGNSKGSPYSWTKAINTEHIINYSEWFNINFAIVYFYNVFGGREISTGRYATLIGIYKEIFKSGQDIYPVVSPGTQLRNFTHFSDIVSGLIHVAMYGKGDGYGIGSDQSYSVLEVVKMFNGKPEFLPKRKGNRMSAKLITSKTKDLGWSPKVKLESYIHEFKESLHQEK